MRRLILPPTHLDEETTHTARLTYAILYTVMLAATVFYSIMLFVLPQSAMRWLSFIVFIDGTGLVALALVRAGRGRQANILSFCAYWAIITLLSLSSGGIHAPATSIYLILVFIVGLLMGERAGIVAGVICGLTGLGMLVAELAGALPAPAVIHSPLALWLNLCGLIAMVMTLQFIAMRRVSTALLQARSELADRRRAEDAAHASELRLRSVIDATPLGAHNYELQTDGRLIFTGANQSASRILGIDHSPLIGKTIEEAFPGIATTAFPDAYRQIASHGQRFDAQQVTYNADGINGIFEVSAIQTGANRMSAFFSDITARRRTEEALRKSEERFRRIVDTATEGIWLSDADFKTVFTNRRFEEMFGYAQEELIGLTLDHVMFAEDLLDNEQRRDARQQGAPGHYERRFRHKDGHTVWTLISATPLLDVEGHFEGAFSMMADITERKATEQALRESEERFRVTFERAPAGMLMQSPDGHFTMVNQTCCDILGYTLEEMLRLTVADITHEDSRSEDVEMTRRLFAGEIPTIDKDKRYVRKDGSTVWCNVNASTVRDASGAPRYAVAVIQDISERKRAEQRMRALDDVSLALSQNVMSYRDELDYVAKRTAEEAGDCCIITLLSDDGQWLHSVACYHTNPEAMVFTRNLLATHPHAANGNGVAASVVRTGQAVLLTDMTDEQAQTLIKPEFQPYNERFGIRNLLMTPLRVGGEVIGAIALLSGTSGRRYVAEDQRFLQELADRAAQAVHNARLYQAAQRRMSNLQSLHTIDSAIAGSLDLHLTLSIALEQVVTQLGVDAADVMLLNRQQGFLEVVASRGFRSNEPARARVHFGQAPAGQIALERRALHISDLAAASAHAARSRLFSTESFVTYSGVPLVTKGEVLGVLEVFRRSAFDGGAEWVQFLEMLAAQVAIAVDNAQMFTDLQRSNMDLTFAYDTTIEGWSQALDLRDKETEGHSQRVTTMTLDLARTMGVSEGELVHMRRGALLHDIGKMGVPDHILLKPGPLTEEEWDSMRRHPQHAFDLLSPIVYLRLSLDIPYAHHEKWDGTGYPLGLKGEQIPLAARIFAVADAYDALLSDRPYRPAWTRERALAHIEAQSGLHFDPQVVKAFLQLETLKS